MKVRLAVRPSKASESFSIFCGNDCTSPDKRCLLGTITTIAISGEARHIDRRTAKASQIYTPAAAAAEIHSVGLRVNQLLWKSGIHVGL